MIWSFRGFAVSVRAALLNVCVACVGLGAVSAGHAQWMWVENNGSKVYSDRPPPMNVPEKNIIKRPYGSVSAVSQGTKATKSAAPSASNSTTTTSDATSTTTASSTTTAANAPATNDLDAKKKKADADADAKKQADQKAEDERVAKAREDNCRRAKESKAQLEAGAPTRITNAKGEQVLINDAMRAAEIQRAQQIIQTECGPLPQSTKKP